ncbi:YgcG family protein [Alcanivorax sp. 24]|uniref:TPM domain-containing protein n=1 Tax=Alcanivorax sp. 24 TaxID=2545266 RepID=UPI00105CD735|nr:TPM domain-containing protein [Alcanivorax sp. 24]
MRLLLCTLLMLVLPTAWAAPEFPALTGRVVDNAGLLSSQQARALEQRLAEAESRTSNQVVVVTLPDLQGYTIEDYGYQLGRAWGLGQVEHDNGALLIVAPNERKVRIEVGYGLEGVLTDALSHSIIQNGILPAFRQGDFATGIEQGVTAILAAINGEYTAPVKKTNKGSSLQALIYLIVLVVLTMLLTFGGGGRGGGRRRGLFAPIMIGGMGGFGGGGGGGFGGGGFGGGGGGFGGGGASGGW